MSKSTDNLYNRGYNRGLSAGRIAGYEIAITLILYCLYSIGFTDDEL